MARRTGKIARLPWDIREDLNLELENGLSYSEICRWLAEQGYPGFNKGHISSWYKGGYQDWLKDLQRLEELNERMDYVRRFNLDLDGDTFQEANLKLAAIQCFEVFNGLDVEALQEKLSEKPELYLRLINSLCRLTKSKREFLTYQQEQKASKEPNAFELFQALLSSRKKAQGQSRDEGPESRAGQTEDGKGIEDEGEEEGMKAGGASQGEPVRVGTSKCELEEGLRAEGLGLRAGQPEDAKRVEDGEGVERRTETGGQQAEGLRPSCQAGGANGKGECVTKVGGQRTELQTNAAEEDGAPCDEHGTS